MAKSMTGFGRAQDVLHGREISVEIKSVNSRYFEYSARIPRSVLFVDEALKKTVNQTVQRGKVEVHVSVHALEAAEMEIAANLAVAAGYYEALGSIATHLRIDNDIKASDMMRLPEVFVLRRAEADEDEVRDDILTVARAALAQFDAMREAEGEKLSADILQRLGSLEEMVREVEKDSEGRTARYTARLRERLEEVLGGTGIDEARMLTEAAIFADKTAVDEESVRLHSHIAQYRQILAEDGQKGRKLDFLTQELNRETNTIGSKCQEVEITRLVVEMKAEIEKIREQIQNLE